MENELKILIENIKNFRQLITEGVGASTIVDAINNHEWIYLYYNADNEEGKNASGYRTVRPYVLGKNADGNLMLRAWQDNPKNSWHFQNKATRDDSLYHDYWTDQEGSKPGWRMFRVDKISKIYPIGKKFNDSNGLPMIPAGYHEGGDDDMTNIIAYVSTKKQPDFDYKYDKEQKIDVVPKADRDKEYWDSIRRGNKNSKQITANDVIKLRDIASRVSKKSQGSYLVTINDKGDFQLINVKDKEKHDVPDTAIVGSLPYLIDSLVKKNTQPDKKFYDDVRNKTLTDLSSKEQSIDEKNIPSIPYKKTTFFKK